MKTGEKRKAQNKGREGEERGDERRGEAGGCHE